MSELSGPSNSWYNPPDLHEVCICTDCHETGSHDEIERWAESGCEACAEKLEEAVKENDYCLVHHEWYCEGRSNGLCHEHGAINGGSDCTQHYLEA